jgi:hypothetical protein
MWSGNKLQLLVFNFNFFKATKGTWWMPWL